MSSAGRQQQQIAERVSVSRALQAAGQTDEALRQLELRRWAQAIECLEHAARLRPREPLRHASGRNIGHLGHCAMRPRTENCHKVKPQCAH